MKCSKCGQQIPNGFLRCFCGGEVEATSPWSTDAFQVIDDGASSLEADELDAILKELEKELDNTNR